MVEHFEMFFQENDDTEYVKIDGSEKYVREREVSGRKILEIDGEGLSELSRLSLYEISHYYRRSHLLQVCSILEDEEASENDKMVARSLLKNAIVSAEGVLPMCQDTGTAIIKGYKGESVWVNGDDSDHLSYGVKRVYSEDNLRFSQLAPITAFEEVNTKSNLPAQIELYATKGSIYKFFVMAKGGGSANKTYLYQETKALLNEKSFLSWAEDKMKSLGTAACPPYHISIVIGGTSAELNLSTVKLASARYYDNLPTRGDGRGGAIRDIDLESKLLKIAQSNGIGAQFGGKYFCYDVRVIRLPRHGASCPVGIGVSCSADRQMLAKVTNEGIFLEKLEHDPSSLLLDDDKDSSTKELIKIDLEEGMDNALKVLSSYPVRTQVLLKGTIIVARDIAHAKLKELLEEEGSLPDYIKDYPIIYAGPAKTPEGYQAGSFGPTTSNRMDSYVDLFQRNNGSKIMIGKGNRSKIVREACKRNGGFYLGTTGGIAAVLSKESIKSLEVLEWEELGMEAIFKMEVDNFPATILIDDKGNDFFAQILE